MNTHLAVGTWTGAVVTAVALLGGCGDDGEGGTVADRYGVGAECLSDDDCQQTGLGVAEACLTSFKGGYCGIANCDGDVDCPSGARCVAHRDGVNYCFRTCADKSECNLYRAPDNESNCSSNVTYVDPDDASVIGKACVPPSA